MTEEQINKIIKLHTKENKTARQISKIMNLYADGVIKILKENNVWEDKRYKYFKNEHYFDKIDTEKKAYWLGFIIADGHISKENQIMIGIKDENLLDDLSNEISNGNIPITKQEKFDKKSNKNIIIYSFSMRSKIMTNCLKNMGLNNRKSWGFDVSELKKHIPEKLINHFIRGYFDGDGSVGIYTQTHNKEKKYYNLSIVGIENLLIWFKETLLLNNIKIRYDKRTKCMYILKTSNPQDIRRIKDFLYNQATIYLKRKYETIEKI